MNTLEITIAECRINVNTIFTLGHVHYMVEKIEYKEGKHVHFLRKVNLSDNSLIRFIQLWAIKKTFK